MRILEHPQAYALSIVRALARRRRIVTADDVRAAASAGLNLTLADVDGALAAGVRRHLIQPKPGRKGWFYSEVFST